MSFGSRHKGPVHQSRTDSGRASTKALVILHPQPESRERRESKGSASSLLSRMPGTQPRERWYHPHLG